MTRDLDPRDLDEVRRRVVMPVARSLIRDGELEDIKVEVGSHEFPLVGREDALSVAIRACGEQLTLPRLWFVDADLWDAEWFADEVYDLLQDEIVESGFGWGDLRHGDYEVLAPSKA